MANKKKTKKAKKIVKAKAPAKKKAPVKARAKKKVKAKATPAAKAKAKPQPKKQIKKVIATEKPVVTKKVNVDYSKAITPLGERLVIRVESAETVTAGGLIIPDSVNQATGFLKAKVLAVGSGPKNKKGYTKPMDVKAGDFVLFSQYTGTKVQFNSEELQIIKESDVMGVVQN